MAKKKSPNDFIPSQERFPTGQDGLPINTKPTAGYIDYSVESEGEFEITQAASGHDSFLYRSTTKGKKE